VGRNGIQLLSDIKWSRNTCPVNFRGLATPHCSFIFKDAYKLTLMTRDVFFLTVEQVALFADPNRDQVTHITKVCVKAVPTPMPSSLIRDESTKRQKNPTQTPKSRRAGRFTRHRWCRTRRGRWFDRRLARRRWRPLDMSPAARLWALRRLDFHSTN